MKIVLSSALNAVSVGIHMLGYIAAKYCKHWAAGEADEGTNYPQVSLHLIMLLLSSHALFVGSEKILLFK